MRRAVAETVYLKVLCVSPQRRPSAVNMVESSTLLIAVFVKDASLGCMSVA